MDKKFEEIAPTLGNELGAPIMQIVKNNKKVLTMEGYEDTDAFKHGKGYDDLIDTFLDNRDQNSQDQADQDEYISQELIDQLVNEAYDSHMSGSDSIDSSSDNSRGWDINDLF